MADGAGLLKEADGTFTLVNNIEADYSVARIKFDESIELIVDKYVTRKFLHLFRQKS